MGSPALAVSGGVGRNVPDEGLAAPPRRPAAPFWNPLLAWVAARLPLRLFKRVPEVVIIDVTNSCNLRCPVCPVTFAMTRARGLMPLGRFQRIIDDLGRHGLRPAMFFNFSGEPTVSKALPDMIAYANARGHETFVSTNATKLDRETSTRIIEAGLSRISLCLDGFSKEAQEAYRVRSDFDEVKRNIETFLEVKRELGADKPVTVLQTLLTSYSETQIDDMVGWARSVGFDKVRFKSFSLGSYTDEATRAANRHLLPTGRSLRRHQVDRERATCSAPLHQTVVFWNGHLGLCCIDYDRMVELPEVDTQGFVAALRSDAAARARRAGFAKQFEICRTCSYSNADTMGFSVDLRGPGRAIRPAA